MIEVTVKSKHGIHARPASLIVELSAKHQGNVTFIKSGERFNGKSIMSIMRMGLSYQDQVAIEVEGEDAETVESKLKEIIENHED